VQRMDRARTVGGLIWVVAGVAFQLAWLVAGGLAPGPVTTVILGTVGILAVLVMLRPHSRAAWLMGWVTAGVLALDLAGAVADRFGLLGKPGAPGVSWGSWSAFEDYTAVLLHHPSHAVLAVVAVVATVVEVVLALLLLSGWQRRWVGKALAGLFSVYLVAMATSLGLDEVATYGMPVLVGGALLVSSCRPRPSGGGNAAAGAAGSNSVPALPGRP
jgi:hypothetical protein